MYIRGSSCAVFVSLCLLLDVVRESRAIPTYSESVWKCGKEMVSTTAIMLGEYRDEQSS